MLNSAYYFILFFVYYEVSKNDNYILSSYLVSDELVKKVHYVPCYRQSLYNFYINLNYTVYYIEHIRQFVLKHHFTV